MKLNSTFVRYDANRWCLGMPLVDPLIDYVHPIPEAFYPPPFLSQSIDGRPDGVRVPFPARPPNQVFRDIGKFFLNSSKFIGVFF